MNIFNFFKKLVAKEESPEVKFDKLMSSNKAKQAEKYPHIAKAITSITIDCDPTRVTPLMQAEIKKQVYKINGLNKFQYEVALRLAIHNEKKGYGGGLGMALQDQLGIDKKEAMKASRNIVGSAISIHDRQFAKEHGKTQVMWRACGVPCGPHTKKSNYTNEELERCKAHADADGLLFDPQKGLLVLGEYIWPGCTHDCSCRMVMTKSIIDRYLEEKANPELKEARRIESAENIRKIVSGEVKVDPKINLR
jgi:hypothetical protein